MRVLGINRTQDASICILDSTANTIRSIRKERLSGQKHAWGGLNDFQQYYARLPELTQEPFDLVVESYSSDPIRESRQAIWADLTAATRASYSREQLLEIPHHLAHLYSVLPLASHRASACMIIDCMGSPMSHGNQAPIPDSGLSLGSQHEPVEVSSFYRIADQRAISGIAKQHWNCDWSSPAGLGAFYYLLTKCLFDGPGAEGKVMALASYGQPTALDLPPLGISKGYEVTIPAEWLDAFESTGRLLFSRAKGKSLEDVLVASVPPPNLTSHDSTFRQGANLAAAGQAAFETALISLFTWLVQETGASEVLFAGGTALNCVANGKLCMAYPAVDVVIPVAPDDGGTAVGAAVWGALFSNLGTLSLPRNSYNIVGFLEEPPVSHASYPSLPSSSLQPQELVERVVSALVRGKIVGLYQGLPELGPRALGNRSILADPRLRQTRERLNSRIKGREHFRPVAPVVLADRAHEFFEMHHESPYMQFAFPLRREAHPQIPAAVHIDGTSRLQTIGPADNALLYGIVKHFGALTGIPVLINTSLNPQNAPIVQTREQALAMLRDLDLDAMCIDGVFYEKLSA